MTKIIQETLYYTSPTTGIVEPVEVLSITEKNGSWKFYINSVEEMSSKNDEQYCEAFYRLLLEVKLGLNNFLFFGAGDLQLPSEVLFGWDSQSITVVDPIVELLSEEINPMVSSLTLEEKRHLRNKVKKYGLTFSDFIKIAADSLDAQKAIIESDVIIFDISDLSNDSNTLENEIFSEKFEKDFEELLEIRKKNASPLMVMAYVSDEIKDPSISIERISKFFNLETSTLCPYGRFKMWYN